MLPALDLAVTLPGQAHGVHLSLAVWPVSRLGARHASHVGVLELATRPNLPRSVEFVFDTIFRRRETLRTGPPLVIGDLKPLGLGKFQFSVASDQSRRGVLEFSADLREWEPIKEAVFRGESLLEDRRAAEENCGFYRVRCGDLLTEALGFLKLEAVPGYNLFGYSFCHPTGCLSEVLHWLPQGAEVTRFDANMMKLRTCTLNRKWSELGACLKNGEGFLFYNPTSGAFPLTMSGRVPQQQLRATLQPGSSLRASMLPFGGDIEKDLGVPISAGETLTLYYADRKQYAEFKRAEHGWSEPPPKIRAGEGFWLGKKSPADWTQSLANA